MKHSFTLFCFFCTSLFLQAQNGTHTLQHIAPEEATATPNYWGQTSQGMPLWGYHAGHNTWGDEAFGEKFEIDGHGDVVGIMAYIGGAGNSNWQIKLKLHAVGPNGLPGAELGSVAMGANEVNTTPMSPTLVTFSNAVHVDDEFFVIFDLDDYSHELQMLDTLVLMMGPNGSRPASDDVYGRNVIRWHGHGAANWKDFRTENFTNWSTYFAIYPIMDGDALATNSNFLNHTSLNMYPVPFHNELNIRFDAKETRDMFIRVFAVDGKLLKTERHMTVQGENFVNMGLSELPSGAYIIALEAGDFRMARKVMK